VVAKIPTLKTTARDISQVMSILTLTLITANFQTKQMKPKNEDVRIQERAETLVAFYLYFGC
jgi:hypothetical protein